MKSIKPLSVAAAITVLAASAYGLDFSYTGNLANDDDVQLFNFTVGATSTVTLRTWSYAGGMNAAGDTIARGGFDPILALFDNAGMLITQNDDGGSSFVAADSVTGAYFDTYLSSTLAAGSYTVSVMQYSNFAIGPNLANGFDGSGVTGFVDVTENQRTSAWAFDILNVDQATAERDSVPEGGSSLLLLTSGLGAVLLKKADAKEGISSLQLAISSSDNAAISGSLSSEPFSLSKRDYY